MYALLWARSCRGSGMSEGAATRTTPTASIAVPVGQSPPGIAYGAGSIWVANTGDGTVSRIDPDTHTVTQTITVHAQPVAIAVTHDDVWVASSGDGSVSRINVDSGTEVDRIPVGNVPAAIAAGP